MPSNRPNLTRPHLSLDESSFQGLLSAAFTIQEHNERRKQARQAQAELATHPEPEPRSICPQCGAQKTAEASRCETCDQDEFRPGERLQHNWASMWLMSQQQGLWPNRSPIIGDATGNEIEVDEPGPSLGPATPERISPTPGTRLPLAKAENGLTASNFLARPITREVRTKTNPPEASPKAPEQRLDQGLDQSLLDDLLSMAALDMPASGKVVNGKWIPEETGRGTTNPSTTNSNEEASTDLLSEAFHPKDLSPGASALAIHPLQLQASAHTDADTVRITEVSSHYLNSTDLNKHDPNTNDLNSNDLSLDDQSPADIREATPRTLLQRLAHLRVTLRFHRADLYLGAAVFVAVFALLWPAATSPRKPALGLWERALISLGIAEAPVPVVHLQGDPAIQVWIDPHTALYYCPGEEQYGKTSDGRYSAQHEAQLDRFEPASRSACE